MPSRKTVGAAPLLTGLLLASNASRAIVQTGPSLWSVPSLVGGCAAVLVGLGILLEWGSFETDGDEPGTLAHLALVGLAVVSVAVGVAGALV